MRFRDKFSDQEWKNWNLKRVERSRAFLLGRPIPDKFGNHIQMIGKPDDGTERLVISNGDIEIKLSFGEDECEGFVRIGKVTKHEDGSKTYISADGKTTIYVGETIEIKDTLTP